MYLELAIDPLGWQAIWKIPRLICEKFRISYPTIVLAYVDSIEFVELTATVKILAVQDDIQLPEIHTANLTQLWPTKHQDDTVCLDMQATANALDMLRFFYNHLWRPWDMEEDDDSDWITKHLEVRLHLYYDMKLGLIPPNISEQFRSMLIEARTIQAKLDRLEEEMSDTELSDADLLSEKEGMSERMEMLTDLHIRMAKLKTEVEIIENPVMRKFILKKQKAIEKATNREKGYWLVFKSLLNVEDHIEFVEKVKEVFPEKMEFKIALSIQDALDSAGPNDVVVLNAGKHYVRSVGSMEEGGAMKGLYDDRSKTVIESANEDIMLDFSRSNILLENLTLEAGLVQCGIIVRSGFVRVKNCRLTGKGESSTQQGILVLSGSEIVLEDCHISGFSTGMFANPQATVTMLNCTISNVGTGLKIFDTSSTSLIDCKFKHCNEYGIHVETESDVREKHGIGDETLLESFPSIQASGNTFHSNQSGNVMIAQKSEIFPVRDLFSNPAFNTTMMKLPLDGKDSDNDEEMEVEDKEI
ncbi:nessun dorma [Carabus blaptoides fortunei]